MSTVYKYTMTSPRMFFTLATGASFLSIKMQKDLPQLYFLTGSGIEFEEREFIAFNTGQEISEDVGALLFLGTVESSNGIVNHIFEVLSR